jgi:WD40 repeat protein/DNA-directed RNA polymerase subunit RPC12/RpoP
MPFIKCPKCKSKLVAPESLQAKFYRCSACDSRLTVQGNRTRLVEFDYYYRVAGLTPLATSDEIFGALRRLIFKHHPDRNAGSLAAVEKTQELVKARDILVDPESRRQYDEICFAQTLRFWTLQDEGNEAERLKSVVLEKEVQARKEEVRKRVKDLNGAASAPQPTARAPRVEKRAGEGEGDIARRERLERLHRSMERRRLEEEDELATPSFAEKRTFQGHAAPVATVAFSPDGHMAVSGSYDNSMRLWDVRRGKELHSFRGHMGYVLSAVFSPDGTWLLSGSGDNTLKQWDLETARELRTFEDHGDEVLTVAVSPNGKKAVSGSYDGVVELWEISRGRELHVLKGHKKHVLAAAFSHDGRLIYSASEDDVLKIWDATSGREMYSLSENSRPIRSAAFNPAKALALTGGQNGTLQLWDLNRRRLELTFSESGMSVTGVAISPDGSRALSGGDDALVKVWDLNTGRKIAELRGHTESVLAVSFGPDGRMALSGSADRTMRLWEIPS